MKIRTRFALLLVVSLLLLTGCLFLGALGAGLPHVNAAADKAIFFMRLNRVIAGFFVGAALSCAGIVFQAVLRNPLAEPYILGVSSGAGLGAAVIILSGLGLVSALALPLAAFVAAVATLAIVFALAGNRGSPSVYGLILSGIIVSAICSNLLMFLIATAPKEGSHSVIWWMLGDLDPASPSLLMVSSIIIAAGGIGLWALAPELNALTLGRETAHNIGIRTPLFVILALVLATLITASAVCVAGLIGFVGLIVPHVMRSVMGPDHRLLIPAGAIGGGVFLAVCDAFARTVLAPIPIPVGVVTALCGGPFFLMILRRKRKALWVE